MSLKSFKTWFLLAPLVLTACSNVKKTNDDEDLLTRDERKYQKVGKLLGEDTLVFGGERHRPEGQASSGIGVNSYLWRASLDTVSFMPLKQVDPFGGVIVTDWRIVPKSEGRERVSINIFILDGSLRADGVKVSIFRQKLQNGQWVDQPVNAKTAVDLEDTILTRARQLRIEAGK